MMAMMTMMMVMMMVLVVVLVVVVAQWPPALCYENNHDGSDGDDHDDGHDDGAGGGDIGDDDVCNFEAITIWWYPAQWPPALCYENDHDGDDSSKSSLMMEGSDGDDCNFEAKNYINWTLQIRWSNQYVKCAA